MSDITLSASARNSLLSLQNTADLTTRAQSRLSTGQKLTSAADDATTYFQTQGLSARSTNLLAQKDQINNAASTIGAAANGLTKVDNLLKQAKSILTSAQSATGTETLSGYSDQYNAILKQIDAVVADSGYDGKNLIAGGTENTVTVQFKPNQSNSLAIESQQIDTSKKGLNLQPITGFGSSPEDRSTVIKSNIQSLDTAIDTVGKASSYLKEQSSILSARQDFTSGFINTLQQGASNLTLADLNSEGANMLALQTRQQIAVTPLSLANQSQQAVLALFR